MSGRLGESRGASPGRLWPRPAPAPTPPRGTLSIHPPPSLLIAPVISRAAINIPSPLARVCRRLLPRPTTAHSEPCAVGARPTAAQRHGQAGGLRSHPGARSPHGRVLPEPGSAAGSCFCPCGSLLKVTWPRGLGRALQPFFSTPLGPAPLPPSTRCRHSATSHSSHSGASARQRPSFCGASPTASTWLGARGQPSQLAWREGHPEGSPAWLPPPRRPLWTQPGPGLGAAGSGPGVTGPCQASGA